MKNKAGNKKTYVWQFILSGALVMLAVCAFILAMPLKKPEQPHSEQEEIPARQTAVHPVFRIYDGNVQMQDGVMWITEARVQELMAADPLIAPDAMVIEESNILPAQREEGKIVYKSSGRGGGGGSSGGTVDTGAEESSDYL